MSAEMELRAEGMETSSSWGTGRKGWAMGTASVVTVRWGRVTGTGPRGGSAPRPSPLKT